MRFNTIQHNSTLFPRSRPLMQPSLKLQSQRKLNHPRAAGEQPCRSADGGSHGAPYRRGDLTEAGAALVTHRVGKIRVIEQVKQVRPELQTHPFGPEREALRCRKIEIDQARSIVLVASGRADPPRWRSLREVARIERRIRIPVVLLYLAASDYVGTVVKLVQAAEVG